MNPDDPSGAKDSSLDQEARRTADRPRRLLRRVPILIAIAAFLNLCILHVTAGAEGWDALRRVSPTWLLLGLAAALVPFVTRSLRIMIWTRALGRPLGVRSSLRVVTSSEVLAAVTPTAVGGAPAKFAFLYREGFRPGDAALLTLLGSCEDAIFFVLAVPIAVWLSPGSDIAPLLSSVMDGLSGGVAATAAKVREITGTVSSNPGAGSTAEGGSSEAIGTVLVGVVLLIVIGLSVWAFVWLVRRFGPTLGHRLCDLRDQFHDARRSLWPRRSRFLLTLPLAFLQWSARYSVVTFVAIGLGLDVDPLRLFLLQCVVFTIMTVVPVPGATGGAEGAFLLFHKGVAGVTAAALMSGWRFLTFMVPVGLAAALLFALFDREVDTAPAESSPAGRRRA